MRWLRDSQRPGALNGDMLVYAPSGATQSARYRLEPRGGSWALCETAAERCWQVGQRSEAARGAAHALIETQPEFLRISVVGEGANRIVFEGARDGCD